MPRLPAPLAQQASDAAAEGARFGALEPGVYTGRLAKVEATTSAIKEGGGGNPMWKLEFDEIKDLDGERKAGRQFTNLVLIDTTMWKVGQFFAAFGVPESTDTDELINHRVRLQVSKRVIQAGARTGQEGNDVNGFDALVDGDDGYAAVQKLAAKLGSAKPAKAAPAKAAAAKVAAETGEAAAAEVAADDDPDSADF